jgi:shikimate kinase/3-dehydroquinate synthase
MTRNLAVKERAGVKESCPLPDWMADHSIVLVGLMGAGKTSIGRRIAVQLGLPFRDADREIERAAGCTIADLFERFDEREFRDGERRVIRRLLSANPLVLATGGGAFMDGETRATVRRAAISVWLRCRLPVLLRRIANRTHRPLLQDQDHEAVLRQMMAARHPVYAEADIVVDCGDDSQDATATQVLKALFDFRPPRRP